ncbi:MAG: hypothetical protein APR54_10350 [Candidatus Cloacimonas sp. SDB]|nr:MAG: hypothetical protein APR54_10350 [Candidatus Cloacimonas sp. SDB]
MGNKKNSKSVEKTFQEIMEEDYGKIYSQTETVNSLSNLINFTQLLMEIHKTTQDKASPKITDSEGDVRNE